LKIYSLKTKNIVFNLRKKIKIENFISNKKILGISFTNGRMEFFNTINFEKIIKIKSNDLSLSKQIFNNEQNNYVNRNKKENHHSTNQNTNSFKINYGKDKKNLNSKINDNSNSNNFSTNNSVNNKANSILFDVTEDYIIFYNFKNKYSIYPSKKIEINKKCKRKYF